LLSLIAHCFNNVTHEDSNLLFISGMERPIFRRGSPMFFVNDKNVILGA